MSSISSRIRKNIRFNDCKQEHRLRSTVHSPQSTLSSLQSCQLIIRNCSSGLLSVDCRRWTVDYPNSVSATPARLRSPSLYLKVLLHNGVTQFPFPQDW